MSDRKLDAAGWDSMVESMLVDDDDGPSTMANCARLATTAATTIAFDAASNPLTTRGHTNSAQTGHQQPTRRLEAVHVGKVLDT